MQNDTSTAVIWPKSKPEVEFKYDRHLGEFSGMSSQSHLPHCRVLPPGEFTVMIQQPRAGCKNSIRHIENRFSPYFFCFIDAVWALTSGGFRIVSDTLVIIATAAFCIDAVHLFVRLSAAYRPINAIFSKTKQFRAMISIDDHQ